jgi:hypothetical protein
MTIRRTMTAVLGLAFAVAVGTLLWPGPPSVQAQPSGCKSFQAIAQETLPTSTPLADKDVWGGPLFGMLGADLFVGVTSGNDGDEKWHGANGQGRVGSYTVCADYPDCRDTFTYLAKNSVFTSPPGKNGIGRYVGNSATIVGGTGKFQYASGNLNVAGPFIVWPDTTSPFSFSGRWNGEISGTICGIQ